MIIQSNYVDIAKKHIYPAAIEIAEGKIQSIKALDADTTVEGYFLPGFVDAHVHIESSMLIPSEFARLAVVHGTVATVSDPHEIANVMGLEGVYYMIENGKKVPFKFNFGAPSCVPATSFETAGAVIGVEGIKELLALDEVKYLAEMMNYPGVIYKDAEVMAKIEAAHACGKPVDGHAPGLRGEQLKSYLSAGISTDHECFTLEEALEKLELGMKVIIREGSAAKNFEALIDILPKYKDMTMFCSDDKHPDDLILGHINQLVARAVAKGKDLFAVLQAACINPVEHYNLDVGLCQVGDVADCIIVEDLVDFKVKQTYINGELVADQGQSLIQRVEEKEINNFNCSPKQIEDFRIAPATNTLQVIQAIDGELITKNIRATAQVEGNNVISNTTEDILKMVVVNRYQEAAPAIAFINGFGLQKGAIASCVGHDSHNIIAVGTNDQDICTAVNALIEHRGGIAAVDGEEIKVLPLPVAGIMTTAEGTEVAAQYAKIDRYSKKKLGAVLKAPFMSLSFMALLVIPQLKLSDKGLFDGGIFAFTDLFIQD